MAANNAQVQVWFEAVRRECEAMRSRVLNATAIKLGADDVYANLDGNPNFVDARDDVPEKATPQLGLSYIAFITAFKSLFDGSGENDAGKAALVNEIRNNYATVQSLCVRLPSD